MPARSLARFTIAVALAFPIGVAFAQDDDEPQVVVTTGQAAAPKPELKPEDQVKAFDKAIKGLPIYEGAFTLFVRKKELLMQLPESDLGKLWLLQATLGTGAMPMGLQAGDPVASDENIDVFMWEKHEDALWLVRPNLRFRWGADDPLGLASQRSFQRAILGSFKVEQTNPLKRLLLVNVTGLFMGDVLRLAELVNAGGGSYQLDREKCEIAKVRSFKENAVVRMQLHFWSAKGPTINPLLELLGIASPSMLEDPRSLPLSVTYNLWYRKDDGYMPRLFDPRVGYFTTDFFDVAKFTQPNRAEHYIERFPLKRKDPTAKTSEPVKPILWTIDPSVPPEYRQACKDGVLMWNRAFEQLGYKNAVQVQDAPDDPDYDHADGRYNVIRWTISPDISGAYAISQFRTDPFTGEILNAAITVDANYMAAAFAEQQNVVTPAADTGTALNALFRSPQHGESVAAPLWKDERQARAERLRAMMRRHGWSRVECDFAEGLRESAAFAWHTLEAAPGGVKISREDYAKQLLKETVCHEVGHCLGLRHNFTGSTELTTAQLGDDKVVATHGDTASVMDYCPVNILSALKGRGYFYTPRIGAYDMWAIRYGYGDVAGGTPTAQRYGLSRISSHSGEPGLAYMTDENADTWDPYVVRFDNSRDPLNYIEKVMEAAARVRRYAIGKLPRPGESFEKRTTLLLSSLMESFSQGQMAVRFVGGMHASRNFKGDVGERPTLAPVDAALQRRAVNLVVRHCLSLETLAIPESVLQSLSLDPDSATGATWTAPLRRLISTRQSLLYLMLMAGDVTDRICENQFKTGSNGYTIEEHFATILGSVFREIGLNRKIASTRRDLQRFAVSALITQAGAPQGAINDDVRMLASEGLQRLSHRMAGQLTHAKGLDGMTLAHLRDAKQTIDRFLARRMSVAR